MTGESLDLLCINTIRTLSIDAVQQAGEYRDSVLPPHITARVAIEQASTLGWERFVGRAGRVIGMKTFGASAPLAELQRKIRL